MILGSLDYLPFSTACLCEAEFSSFASIRTTQYDGVNTGVDVAAQPTLSHLLSQT